jgi:hypothetical protein
MADCDHLLPGCWLLLRTRLLLLLRCCAAADHLARQGHTHRAAQHPTL